MPSPAAYTIYFFALPTFLLGLRGLWDPTSSLQTLNLPAAAAPSVQASSLGAIAISIFYCLAAYQENRAFFKWSLLTRSLTTAWALRMGGGWTALGVWEGVGALGTAVALAVGRA
ncbi:hypothetical protein BU26DRAFT_509897 [Trematosphaeria pertusa]|uniref:Uncharacterized protein n=1 Tax=Trematosphaeria pertusa TaxID=390896 RepID=A0A6A6I0F6_9PLEO|nr:uncharacterized protein BU26DRAFT_509897 [Trematosphaeria pertusa]KAF2243373.1 hypothetical protein BU26DRAFT_509897 [Trematosphaeria pertusa]